MNRQEKIQNLIETDFIRGFLKDDEYIREHLSEYPQNHFYFSLEDAYVRYEFNTEGVNFHIIKNIEDTTDCDFSQKWEDIEDSHLNLISNLI
jgi:hypothetical protein